jgi:glycosyltransferase involved in cell wall biosynthesis
MWRGTKIVMKGIKIFALVEGKTIDKLSDRVSGTWIRIHYILKYLKQKKDIELIYIPFEYKQRFSEDYSRINWFIDLFYHFAIPLISCLIILFRRPDFIYFSYPNAIYNNALNVVVLRFAKQIGIKLLMYSHDWVEQRKMVGRSEREILFLEKLEWELVRKSDLLIVVLSKYPEYETAVLPGGFDEEEFANLRYETHENRFNIAHVGAIMPHHSISLLVDSTIMLHEKYPHIRLLLFGKMASLDGETKRKIEESGFILHQTIPRTRLISSFSEVDVFVYSANPNIPYANKASSAKLFEYIGSEIPFIATQCEGVKVISDGKGFLWVDYSAEDFCKKLEYLLKNPQERMRLSQELRELKRDNTWRKRADTLHDVIVRYCR